MSRLHNPKKWKMTGPGCLKFVPMQHRLYTGLLLFWIVAHLSGQQVAPEFLQLAVKSQPGRIELSDTTWLHLDGANASILLGDKQVDIYRWVLSARDTGDVTANLAGAVWVPVTDAHVDLPLRPTIRVHSPQVWGTVRVVLLDLFPWQLSQGRLEALQSGRLEVMVRHPVAAEIARNKSTTEPGASVANNTLILAARPRTPSAGKAAAALPASGTWIKAAITQDGLTHLTGSDLADTGVNLGSIIPAKLRLYAPAALGRPLPDKVGTPMLENLVELAIQVRAGVDGKFDNDDDIVFYAQGPRGTDLVDGTLRYIWNPYTDSACVWLFIPDLPEAPDGLRSGDATYAVSAPTPITIGQTLVRYEVDAFNGFESGPVWHHVSIAKGESFNILLDTPELRTSDSARISVKLRGGHKSVHRARLELNHTPVATSPSWSAFRDITIVPDPATLAPELQSDRNTLTLVNITSDTDPQEALWLDWAEIFYHRNLSATEDVLNFLIPSQELANIHISGFSSAPLIFDITNPAAPIFHEIHAQDNAWALTPVDLAGPRRYAAATEGSLLLPAALQRFPNLNFANLRQPDLQVDYIIITDATLLSAAEDLARIHSQEVRPEYRLTTLVTTVDEIYEEFSGGMADPYALRAFLRYAHENWTPPTPNLVCLFGDGDYDYRNITGNSRILVPTIQLDGLSEISSRSSDDYFIYLDSTISNDPNFVILPDMGIGRIPASSPDQAQAAIDVVRQYMVSPEPGAWRQRLLLAADDPVRPKDLETSFIRDSENLAGMVPPFLQINKLYLTEYAEVLDPATNTIIKPDATDDLIRAINQGVALINYIGHGSSTQWAQEQLLKIEHWSLLEPGYQLPVWVAGTCTWGRYDQLESSSMSEILTAGTNISGIGIVSATRAVYSSQNTAFVTRLFKQIFPDTPTHPNRLGKIVQRAKLAIDDDKFHLFGDPAIIMAFPHNPLTLHPVTPDTLKVLGLGAYSGMTYNAKLSVGEVLVTVLDAPRPVTRTYRSKDGTLRTISYTLTGAALFRGSATLSGSNFAGQFVVPKDINYSGQPASIIAYGWSQEDGVLHEQIGYRDDLLISGTETTLDTTGPIISLYWNGRPVNSGSTLPYGAEIEVELKDPLGINLSGEVGHTVRVWINDETAAETMDPLFRYDLDSYMTGRFTFALDPTLTGKHDLAVEAWDGGNNRSLTVITIQVSMEEDLDVVDLFNYPNPFQNHTDFVYTLSVPAEVTITLFTLNGVKIVTLYSIGTQGPGFQRLPWDGADAFGDQIANGTYLYLFRAETFDGAGITRWGRLARLR